MCAPLVAVVNAPATARETCQIETRSKRGLWGDLHGPAGPGLMNRAWTGVYFGAPHENGATAAFSGKTVACVAAGCMDGDGGPARVSRIVGIDRRGVGTLQKE